MMFWVLAGLLTVLVLAALLLPQFRAQQRAAGRSEYDINVYKDQLSELERDLAEGRIAETEAEAARLEVQRRLLAAADTAEAEKSREVAPAKGRRLVFVASILVPVAAFGMYLKTGTPGMPDFPMAERTDIRPAPVADANDPEGQAIGDLAKRLEERLRENPDDSKGWILLARTYGSIGQPRSSAAAYQRAIELLGRDPELLADWAEARLMSRNGSFTPEIFGDFLEAREKNPVLPKPWFYIGLDKAFGGDLLGAAQLWTDLLTIHPDNATFGPTIRAQIARAAEEGGFALSDLQPSEKAKQLAEQAASEAEQNQPPGPSGQPAQANPAAPGPSREDVEAAQQMTAEERNAFIRSMVTRLAEKLEENPNDPAGWERLIRAYDVLGEAEKAAAARQRLKQIQGN
ncbi:MAG: c-type cytochrome biogenesis protein CcmI [Rhodospirillales bacterium]